MVGLVDCDLHIEVEDLSVLLPYLSEHAREYIDLSGFKGPSEAYHPKALQARPATTFEGLSERILEPGNVDLAILNCSYAVDSVRDPDLAVALARAVNEWQIAEWLERDSRLRASIVVPSQMPQLAAEEINRVSGHASFVQVLLPVRSQHPYGSSIFHPLWSAIEEHGLVAAITFGGAPGNPTTSAGWPTYFLEEYAAMAGVFATQLTSLIAEGVFSVFPGLHVTLLESGVTWLPAHMWRLDQEWRALRRLVPWVKRPPSEYIREHVRLSIQPLDSPPSPEALLEVVSQLGSDHMLLYASDYPHRSGDNDLLNHLPQQLAERVFRDNALGWYQLQASRTRSQID
jgi:predicted TIM-barrel fold metal-dependent hydrolase